MFLPSSGWKTSAPEHDRDLDLWPRRELDHLTVLVLKSPIPIFGRYFISLIPTLVVFRRDSLAFWPHRT